MALKKRYNPEKLAWEAEIEPETERVWDEASGTWSNVPVTAAPEEKVVKKKASKKKVSKKK